MEAPYTAYEARTGTQSAIRQLENQVATLKGICGVLFVAFIALVLVLVTKFHGLNRYAEEINEFATAVSFDIYDLQQEQVDIMRRLNEDAPPSQEEEYEVPAPNTSAYVPIQ